MIRALSVGILFLIAGVSQAQAPALHPAFRLKLIEAIQEVDAMNDPVSFPLEESMNRVQARRSVQELGRAAVSTLETNIAAHLAQHLLSVRTCIFGRSTSTPAATRECLDRADTERNIVLKLAGIDSKSVYPHAS